MTVGSLQVHESVCKQEQFRVFGQQSSLQRLQRLSELQLVQAMPTPTVLKKQLTIKITFRTVTSFPPEQK
jgi:hypothetical protein